MKNILVLFLVSTLCACSGDNEKESIEYVDAVDFKEFQSVQSNRFGILKSQADSMENSKVSNQLFNDNSVSVDDKFLMVLDEIEKLKKANALSINEKKGFEKRLSEYEKTLNHLKTQQIAKKKKVKKRVKPVVVNFSLSQINSWGSRYVAVIKIDNAYKTFSKNDYLKNGWFITDIQRNNIKISHTNGLSKSLKL